MWIPRLISSLLRGAGMEGGGHGFVFAPLSEPGEWACAAPGVVIRNASAGPPWVVVAHTTAAVLGVGWPGKLWEVEILEAAADQPREGAGYTRAVAVRIRQEVPVSVLFGAHGDDVLRVIETASSLGISEAMELARRWPPEARAAYSRAWNSWLTRVEPGSIHRGADHVSTLAVFAGSTRSPIGIGFTLLYDVFGRRARELAGDEAFETDEEGEVCFTEPWGKAADVLLYAAMAVGAPELLSPQDRAALIRAWKPDESQSTA